MGTGWAGKNKGEMDEEISLLSPHDIFRIQSWIEQNFGEDIRPDQTDSRAPEPGVPGDLLTEQGYAQSPHAEHFQFETHQWRWQEMEQEYCCHCCCSCSSSNSTFSTCSSSPGPSISLKQFNEAKEDCHSHSESDSNGCPLHTTPNNLTPQQEDNLLFLQTNPLANIYSREYPCDTQNHSHCRPVDSVGGEENKKLTLLVLKPGINSLTENSSCWTSVKSPTTTSANSNDGDNKSHWEISNKPPNNNCREICWCWFLEPEFGQSVWELVFQPGVSKHKEAAFIGTEIPLPTRFVRGARALGEFGVDLFALHFIQLFRRSSSLMQNLKSAPVLSLLYDWLPSQLKRLPPLLLEKMQGALERMHSRLRLRFKATCCCSSSNGVSGDGDEFCQQRGNFKFSSSGAMLTSSSVDHQGHLNSVLQFSWGEEFFAKVAAVASVNNGV